MPSETKSAPRMRGMRISTSAAGTTLPALSVPAGFTDAGLPVGLQLVGAPRGERALLAIAAAVEELLGAAARRPPESRI